jgi:hypothetical protein
MTKNSFPVCPWLARTLPAGTSTCVARDASASSSYFVQRLNSHTPLNISMNSLFFMTPPQLVHHDVAALRPPRDIGTERRSRIGRHPVVGAADV